MPMTDLLKDLEAVALLAEKATPGEWAIGPYGGIYKTDAMGKLQGALLVGESKSGFYENRSANEAAASNAVNFIRTHHAEIVEAVKDARRWRHARKILPVEYIEGSQREFESYGLPGSEEENIAADNAIDAAMHNSAREVGE